MTTPALYHVHMPALGSACDEDVCADHLVELEDEHGGRDDYRVIAAPPGAACGRCADMPPGDS